MAKDREPPTLADYATLAISPTLIMGLVGSLAFFLLEVGYQGRYSGKLEWTLFFFVFGAVLVSRIAITLDATRAWLYGIALGGAVMLAMMKYMEYEPGSSLAPFGWLINLGIIAVVLWSANKLTWDCTYIDEKDEDTGRGLMTEVGRQLAASGPKHLEEDKDSPKNTKRKPIGVWVVYFSLAALPIFGLGQALIPAEDAGRRRYVFWLMVVYVGSGLGLLLTTCFLGVRRYLRQRKQPMPPAMAAVWLGSGLGLILLFLIVGALLPRPLGEYQVVSITPLGSRERDASQYAMRSDEAGKGEGDPGGKGKDEDKDAKDGSGGQGQKGGKEGGKTGKAEGGSKDGNASGSSKNGSKGKGKDGKGDDRDKSKASGEGNSRSDSRGDGQKGEDQRSSPQTNSPRPPDVSPPSALTGLANVLKWIVLGLLAIAAIVLVVWFALKHLSSAHKWARDLLNALAAFWRSLFGGGRQAEEASEQEEVPVEVVERPRPFADFPNPFNDGSAPGRSPEELVRYSFTALEAWANDRDLPRGDDETPLEFAERLGEFVPTVEAEVRQLTGLYARLAYARRRLPDTCRPAIEQFWRRLEGPQTQVMASGSRHIEDS